VTVGVILMEHLTVQLSQ